MLDMESPLEYMTHLALEMTRKVSYTHEYKRERDFNLESACMHFISLNRSISDALNICHHVSGNSKQVKHIPCIPYLQLMSILHSQLLVSLQ